MTDDSPTPVSAVPGTTQPAAVVSPIDVREVVNERLEHLHSECNRMATAIYRGDGVPPSESLPFLSRVGALVMVLQGVSSLDTVADVLEMLDEEAW